jgi:hypothetical protein
MEFTTMAVPGTSEEKKSAVPLVAAPSVLLL